MIRLVENILTQEETDKIEQTLLGWNFGWFHYANTNYADQETKADDVPQFSHGFMREGQTNSPFVHIPEKIMHAMGVPSHKILRAKANLLTWERTPHIHPRHVDDETPHYGMIFYVNDSDGDTHFYENGKSFMSVTPRKGCAVLFDGNIQHASSSPIQNRFRIVINFNTMRDVAFLK